MTPLRTVVILAAAGLAASCAEGPPPPAALDTAQDNCRSCRMAVSDQRFAAQIVAPGEDPLFFDDLGCLRRHVEGVSPLPSGAVIYVADHRTSVWVPGSGAVFTKAPGLETPMGGGIVAHADAASRDADGAARGGTDVTRTEALGAAAGGAGR
jgi:copper chaperone NosL